MSFIDEKDAPEGFYAVAAEENIFGVITCHGCVFDVGGVLDACLQCGSHNRFDEQEVIFIKKADKDE